MKESSGEEAIALYDLSRRFGGHYVLNAINLRLSAGRTVLLRGSNGSGKTTLLRVMASRLRPSRGRGTVFGFDLVKESAEVRRQATYLPVLGGAYPNLTALENLQLSARLYGLRPAEVGVGPLLQSVGLMAQRDHLVRTFSSGMKKRLGLARLQLSPARLWLLDEPHAALDESGKSLVDELLESAKEQGKTIVVASHEATRALDLADAVLEVDQGQLRSSGAARPAQLEATL